MRVVPALENTGTTLPGTRQSVLSTIAEGGVCDSRHSPKSIRHRHSVGSVGILRAMQVLALLGGLSMMIGLACALCALVIGRVLRDADCIGGHEAEAAFGKVAVDASPSGWVWPNQEPLVVNDLGSEAPFCSQDEQADGSFLLPL